MTLGSTAFRGASRTSVSELRDQLAQTGGGEQLGSELFAVAGVLDRQPTLRRALTDPSRKADDRANLALSILDGKVGRATLNVVTAAARQSWSRVRDLGDALEYLGVFSEVLGAANANALDELEDELFRFGRIVESTPDLRAVLGDSTIPAERRADLAGKLLEGKSGAATVRLVKQAVATPRGRDLLASLESYAEIAAAWRERLVAIVRSATPLDDAQQDRLREK